MKGIDAHRNLQLIIRSLNCRTHLNVYPLLLNVNSRLDFSSKFHIVEVFFFFLLLLLLLFSRNLFSISIKYLILRE